MKDILYGLGAMLLLALAVIWALALLQQCELPKPICKRMRCGFVGCEINPSYVEMAAGRISEVE